MYPTTSTVRCLFESGDLPSPNDTRLVLVAVAPGCSDGFCRARASRLASATHRREPRSGVTLGDLEPWRRFSHQVLGRARASAEVGGGSYAEFPEHLGQVVVDSLWADKELSCDLWVGGARGGQGGDL